jgi:hypothetical protein
MFASHERKESYSIFVHVGGQGYHFDVGAKVVVVIL